MSQRTIDVLEAILALQPKIVGVGVYIWNVELADPARRRPEAAAAGHRRRARRAGGEPRDRPAGDRRHADYVITGEADLAFADLCRTLLAGRRPLQKVIQAELPEFASETKATAPAAPPLALPYDLYTDEDIAQRVVYVEASRGCPFKCEFCLSSLDVPVRNAPLDAFLAAHGAAARPRRAAVQVRRPHVQPEPEHQPTRSCEFFLERYEPGLFLHFEMIPDRLPEALRELIRQFPPGALQFEVGIQTFNDDVVPTGSAGGRTRPSSRTTSGGCAPRPASTSTPT